MNVGTFFQYPDSYRWKYLFIISSILHFIVALLYLLLGTGEHQKKWFKSFGVEYFFKDGNGAQEGDNKKSKLFNKKKLNKTSKPNELETLNNKKFILLNDITLNESNKKEYIELKDSLKVKKPDSMKSNQDAVSPLTFIKNHRRPLSYTKSLSSSANFSFNSRNLLNEDLESLSINSTTNFSHTSFSIFCDSEFKFPTKRNSQRNENISNENLKETPSSLHKKKVKRKSFSVESFADDCDEHAIDENIGNDGDQKVGNNKEEKTRSYNEIEGTFPNESEETPRKLPNKVNISLKNNSEDDLKFINLKINDSDISESNV